MSSFMQLAHRCHTDGRVIVITSLDGSVAACTDTDNGALSSQDVRSDQPPARGTPSTASGRPLTQDGFICAV